MCVFGSQLTSEFSDREGDRQLQTAVTHLRALVGDRVVRWGGDEFLVFWSGPDVGRVAREVAAFFREHPLSPTGQGRGAPHGTVSIGTAEGAPFEVVMAAAEEALGQAKAAGRAGVVEGGP